MRLKVTDVDKFMKVVESCESPVYLTDWEVNEDGEYNLKLNLKSSLSMYFGIAKLLGDKGDWLEIHTTSKEDEIKMMAFMADKI